MLRRRSPLFSALLMLILCASVLVGSTYAQFTDQVVVSGNVITSGNLKASLDYWTKDGEGNGKWAGAENKAIFGYSYWEPGYTDVQYIKIGNTGKLAFQYALSVEPVQVPTQGAELPGEEGQEPTSSANLMDAIDVYYGVLSPEQNMNEVPTDRAAFMDLAATRGLKKIGTLTQLNQLNSYTWGSLSPKGETKACVVLHMQEEAGNEYMNLPATSFNLKLTATQFAEEEDAFGSDYDDIQMGLFTPISLTIELPAGAVENGALLAEQIATDPNTGAAMTVPAGAKIAEGATRLTLNASMMSGTGSNVQLDEGEAMRSYDVHVDGLAADNAMPVQIKIPELMDKALNIGNYSLYHVENGATTQMTHVSTAAGAAHNSFTYDPATGDVTLCMATYSEVAVVADTTAAWEGNFDYSWYTNAVMPLDGEAVTEYTIANADQLAGFGAIVGGMNSQTQDSFAGEYVKLIADINLGDKESENNPDLIFYPIGYNSSDGKYEKTSVAVTTGFYAFEGTFDGQGHTISNFYHNTWEMKGDHDWYSPEEQYYRDGMGLFGKVYGGTVKNLTVHNFSSDGEIATTGVIAAYADGATFENIAITNCNPRVYNIGNGGIVGCVGWYAKDANLKTTFKNITVDNSNKISALWGSYDVACGGLVGQYYPTSGQTSAGTPENGGIHFENCHVSAVMDVYNDVCGNYQYYAYRYAGMIIGSIRENTTNEDGKTIPDMTGISATGCTVNYGDWNDYYYCEFEKNGHPSYSGPTDYKFSRVPHSELKFTDSNSNGLVDANERDSVEGCTHNHTEAENNHAIYLPFHQLFTGYGWGVNSIGLEQYSGIVTDLGITEGEQEESVEKFEGKVTELSNNTTYNLGDIFNFVNKGVDLVPGALTVTVTNLDENYPVTYAFTRDENNWANGTLTLSGTGKVYITIQDYYFCKPTTIEVTIKNPEPVDKFTAKENLTFTHTKEGGTIEKPLSEIFTAIEGATIDSANVTVTVPNGCTYTPNTSDWTKSTLGFTGTGEVTITITDNDLCNTATATVTINEPELADKFETKFTGDFLYRVGNSGTVKLGSLFAAKDGASIGTVSVTVDNEAGNASGTYTSNDTWMNGTIQFSGTGVVKVTIDDDAYANELSLLLEVVNATNVTSYSGLGNRNSVLLDNITMSNGGSYSLSGATLYGNGFTLDMKSGAYAAGGNVSSNYVFNLVNANLDNVKVVGAVYTKYGPTASSDYNRAAVLTSGNCTITNSYISNCASAVRVKDGNLEMINTTVKGGNFANIDIRGGHVILDNVTTINQVDGNDTAENGTVVVGFGVVVYYDNVLSTTTIDIKNGITQYNHLSKKQAATYIKDTSAQTLTEQMFSNTYAAVQYNDGSDTWVNTGILSMSSNVKNPNITDVEGYESINASDDAYLHTMKPNAVSIIEEVPEYVTVGQGAIAPSYRFDFTTKNYVEKTDGSNDYCYEENGTVQLSMDAGDTFNWNTSILTAEKNGETLSYTVFMNGTDYTGKSIAFNTTGNYSVVYTYMDENNYELDNDGEIKPYSKTYTKTVHISVAAIEANAKQAEFTMGSSNAATEKITVDNVTYISATGVTVNDSTWTYMTIGDKKIYYPIVAAKLTTTQGSSSYAYFPVFENVITITDYAENGTGDEFVYNSSTTTLPSTLTAVKGVSKESSKSTWVDLTNSDLTQSGASKIFKWASASDAPSDPVRYQKVLCYKSPQVSADRVAYITLVQYSYTDATNTTYYYYVGYTQEAFDYQSCVTPDTLVTLADGSKKEIQHVTYEDQLLVWDFYKGEYAAVPSAIIFNHGEDDFNIIYLTFEDGTQVKVILEHRFLDAATNDFVRIDEYNAQEYVGHDFYKRDGDGYKTVKLVDAKIVKEHSVAYSLISALHYNFFVEDMFSSPFLEKDVGAFEYFDIAENELKYTNVEEDIAKYGLYSYEDFAPYITKEQYDAFNAQYMKIAVGKGDFTFEEILRMIDEYLNEAK